MADHHPGEVHPLGLEHVLLFESPSGEGVCMRADRYARGPLSPGHGPEHQFHVRCHPLFISGAFEDGRPYAGAGDPVGDVAHEHLGEEGGRATGCESPRMCTT